MQFQRRVGTYVEDDVVDARGATERLENREVEVEDDGRSEGPSETVADGQDCPHNSHRDEENTENQSPWATTKHLRWLWWEVQMFKIKKNTILLLLVGIVMCRRGNTTCEIFSHCRTCYFVTLVI